MTFQRPVRLFLILVAALPVIGCVTTIRKAAPIAPEAVAPIGFPHSVRVVRHTPQIFEDRAAPLIPRLASVADGTRLNILALSGGGAGGAFGAGVLVGWSRAGTRPDFQIVTGVSAGALIAPLAFLGPSWDGVLEEAFSGSQTEHLLQRDAIGALFGSSIYRGGPLAALVDHYVTDALIRAVAAEAAKGRLLLVATTNLDTEQTTIWDLTRIAMQGGEPGRQLFRDVLIASASVPGIFPPVLIRVEGSGKQFDELHVDGGTTASFFIGPDIAEFVPNASTTLRGGNLYVILNEQLGATTKTTPIRTLAIFKRAIAAGINSDVRAELQIAYSLARQHELYLQVTAIPGAYPFHGPLHLGPTAMKPLFDYAARCSVSERIWTTPLAVMAATEEFPPLQADDTMAPCPAVSGSYAPALRASHEHAIVTEDSNPQNTLTPGPPTHLRGFRP